MTDRSPLFSTAHYEFLADVLREAAAGQALVLRFCRALARDNPTFDPVRFARRALGGWCHGFVSAGDS
jgi:hypothetical protein